MKNRREVYHRDVYQPDDSLADLYYRNQSKTSEIARPSKSLLFNMHLQLPIFIIKYFLKLATKAI